MYNETFQTSPPGSSAHFIYHTKKYVKNKNMLDLGCGSGRLCLYASKYAKHVTGIDYIDSAIDFSNKFAKMCKIKNVDFHVADLDYFSKKKFDVITMSEVLQHVDKPLQTFKKCNKLLNKNGYFIVSIPSFNNFRGNIWMTLQSLFGLPMSLTDTYQLSYTDMNEMAQKSGFKLEKVVSTAWDWAWTEWSMDDLKRRVSLAAKDAKISKKTDFKVFNKWLDSNLIFNKQFLDYLLSKKIIQKRPLKKLLNVPKPATKTEKKYLDDGNAKINLYFSDIPPFNRMGEGAIYIMKKT